MISTECGRRRREQTVSRDQLLTGSWRYTADHPDRNVRRSERAIIPDRDFFPQAFIAVWPP